MGASGTGQFTYAVAQAYLFWGIGIYGMRRFQASDVTRQFTFYEYLRSRIITCVAMVAFGLGYAGFRHWQGLDASSTLVLMLLVLGLRLVDSVEDVYLGYFQQNGRLDIGSKMTSLRQIVSTIVIIAAILVTRSLTISIAVGAVTSAVLLLVLLPQAFTGPVSIEEKQHTDARTWRLLVTCAPLFFASLVSIFVSNAPRYAINTVMDSTAQGYFAWLSMPPFLITLLGLIIFNPLVTKMATQWASGDASAFGKRVVKLTLGIGLVSVLAIAGGMVVGIPVLNFITGWDFAGYHRELLLLLLAGGLSALAGLFSTVLTIVRRQAWFTIGVVVSAGVGLTGVIWVRHGQLIGASWLYFALFAVQCVVFGVVLIIVIRKRQYGNG